MPLSEFGALIIVNPDEAKRRILAAVDKAKGNRTHAAEALGAPLRTFHNWCDRLDLWKAIDALCAEKGYAVQAGPQRKPRPRGSRPLTTFDIVRKKLAKTNRQ